MTTSYKFKIECRLKPDILDPEGNAILHSLEELATQDTKATSITRSKIFIIEVESTSHEKAKIQVKKWTNDLLANTVIEDFQINDQ